VLFFAGSAGWSERFKGHYEFHSLKWTGKVAAADLLAAENFPAFLQVTTEQHGYWIQQVFILDETVLFWKQMLSRMFVSVQQKVALRFKASKDHCMTLLGGNTSRDYKIKPLMVLSLRKPSSTQQLFQGGFAVVWISNKQACLNLTLPLNSIMNWKLTVRQWRHPLKFSFS
jgi:hypothetical protein